IEIFVSSFEHPQHTSFTTLTTNSFQYYVPFALENQLAYPYEENSIETELTNKVIVFPNPTKDYIHLNQNENYRLVQIFDINGKLVKTVESGFDKIDVSDFEQGLYIVVINANDSVLTGKFVR
ncbi:MAG: T9SS type A sorting domain-containing protein, partial [Bacteroidales bacterium]|nr:T9SS type A sorting domain-containing protein [Bacteroidales bacterium]